MAKEGLELLGWSLVALALWDEALRRRGGTALPAGAQRRLARERTRRPSRSRGATYRASFSSTGCIETTCRLKRSSESLDARGDADQL